MHHGTCVMHVPWCMSGWLTSGCRENAPSIPGACATRNFTYLARGPWCSYQLCSHMAHCHIASFYLQHQMDVPYIWVLVTHFVQMEADYYMGSWYFEGILAKGVLSAMRKHVGPFWQDTIDLLCLHGGPWSHWWMLSTVSTWISIITWVVGIYCDHMGAHYHMGDYCKEWPKAGITLAWK